MHHLPHMGDTPVPDFLYNGYCVFLTHLFIISSMVIDALDLFLYSGYVSVVYTKRTDRTQNQS